MGNDQVTVKNLEIVEIDEKNNILYIKGAIPGCRNALVRIVAQGEMKLSEPVETVKKENAEIQEVGAGASEVKSDISINQEAAVEKTAEKKEPENK